MLSGLDAETPLGRIVSIRAETDRERIKNFTKEERRIYNEWRNKSAQAVSKEELESALAGFKAAFIAMARKKEG